MQSDYYHSPCQTPQAAVSAQTKQPRRKGGRLVLCLFAVLIVLSAAGLIITHFVTPEDWRSPIDEFMDRFDSFYYGFYDSDDFFYDSDFIYNDDTAKTTIPRSDPISGITLTLNDIPKETLSFQDIYTTVIPSIVSIQSVSDYGVYTGTGVVMTKDGYIITNHHVIAGCYAANVLFPDDTLYEAKLVGSDVESDLAVLKIEATGLIPAQFGNSDQLRVGDTVLAIGNPLGYELFGTMTEGIVSAINRNVYVDGFEMQLIQTTAALNPGNSGGALVNAAGQVIGITNLKMMSSYDTIEGLGFAIPSVWTKDVVDVLISEGAMKGRPTIGITCRTLLPEEWPLYGCTSGGVYVDSITPHGPAQEAGLQMGDVIIAGNGQAITSLEDLTVLRDQVGVGGEMKLTVLRDRETVELTLTLVEQYEMN